MKVVFIEEVANVAEAGDVKEVKNGYARNLLFPRNLAVLATPDQMRRVDALKNASALRNENAESRAEALAPELEDRTIVIESRSGPTGRLYGSVTVATVAAELSRAVGREIAAREVILREPIKAIGTHEAAIRLTPEVEYSVTVEVVEAEEKKPTTRRKPKARVKAPAAAAEPVTEEVVATPESAVEEIAETVTDEAPVAAAGPVTEKVVATPDSAVEDVAEAVTEEGPVAEEEPAEPVAEAVAEEQPETVLEPVTEELVATPESAVEEIAEAVTREGPVAEEEPAEPVAEEPAKAVIEPVAEGEPAESVAEAVAEEEAEPEPAEEGQAAISTRARAKAVPLPEEIDEDTVRAAVRRAKRRSPKARAQTSSETTAEGDQTQSEAGDGEPHAENDDKDIEK